MTPINERQRARLYIYKNKKMQSASIYIQKDKQFSKSKKIYVTFLFTKSPRFFMNCLKLAFIYIQKL